MKKRKLFILAAAAGLLLTLGSCRSKEGHNMNSAPLLPDKPDKPIVHILNPDTEVRGVWIASVYNIDYPSAADLSEDKLRGEIDSILDTCEKNSINTIFFQVRPTCDALYKSELFPVSSFISTKGELIFDPLEYIVKEGHKRNIYIHAWVNPLRVTMNSTDIDSLPENSPARLHPDWAVPYADGKLYLNAGLPEVRELVADGVRELVSGYDVDGVVFDDYFYPYPAAGENGKTAVFDDAREYKKYGKDFDSIGDWRRANVNDFVKQCYIAVHETDRECKFGISPFAIWQNDNGKNGGSATNGFEAYNSLYCDALAWINGGYIDYISPQIYWQFSDSSAPFDTVVRWWNAQLEGSDVSLYVSHASYRYEDGNWSNPSGELTEQINYARSEKYYHGSIFYGYDEINRNINGASDELKKAFDCEIIYTDIQSNGCGVTFSSPENGSVTSEGKTYIIGMSDPYYILTMDGKPVSRTKSGYFSVFVNLEKGENKFVFEQNGVRYLYKINYKVGILQNEPDEKDEYSTIDHLSVTGTYPSNKITTSEDKLWVSCVAAYGSEVYTDIGGVRTKLSPLNEPKKTSVKDSYISVIYGANAALPAAQAGETVDAGKVQYTASHKDGTVTAEGCEVRVIGAKSGLGVRVLNDYTHLKISENSSYYNDYTVQSAGMTDSVVSQRNGYYLLGMGGYVNENDVEEITGLSDNRLIIEAAEITDKGESTEFTLLCDGNPAYNGCIEEDGRFTVTFYNIDSESAAVPVINRNPIIKACEVIRLAGKVRYSFELYDVLNFYGFDLRYNNGTVTLSLKNPAALDFGSKHPLDGVRIVLDAGHGGDDPGAPGAYRNGNLRIMEKDINFEVTKEAAFLLAELGAEIELTRESDSTVSLYERMDYLEEKRPDLSISIHQNSIGYTADATRIRGTLSLWCMDGGRLLSDCVGRAVADSTGRLYRGSDYQALALCRNPKFPQMLVEVGFMTSVEEYEQMTSGVGIKKAAEGIRDGVLKYYEAQSRYL